MPAREWSPGMKAPRWLARERRRDLRNRGQQDMCHPLMIFLPLAAVNATAVCEDAFFWGAIVGEAICGEIFGVVFGEGEQILNLNSRDLYESTNVMGNFCHRQLDALIDPAKNTQKKEHLSYQEHRCGVGRRSSSVRISILIWIK